jgi:hypothetical protein
MLKLLRIDFPFEGPFGQETADAPPDLARSIAREPGQMHTERLKAFGIPQVNAKVFDVNEALSRVTRGPLS